MSQDPADNMNDLEQLKELLFGAEKEALDSIAERVEQPEIRTADVADVLAEAIHQSHKKDKELVESLTIQYNRARQAAVTTDLMDIVGGAEALAG